MMKLTRLKTTVMAGVMAASMLMPGMTVLADDTQQATAQTPAITKNVTVADGIVLPQTNVIKFTATQETGANKDGIEQPLSGLSAQFSLNVSAIENKTGSITDLSALTDLLTKNGEYTFKLTENTDLQKTGTYGWEINPANTVYYLHVYVSGIDGTNVANKKVEWIVTTGNTVTTDASGKVTNYVGKVNKITFTNVYTEQAGNPTDGSLSIEKAVDGTSKDYGAGESYTFTVSFEGTDTYTIDSNTELAYTVGSTSDKWTQAKNTITLKDGEKAVFTDIPAGVEVTVTEAKATNIKSTKIEIAMNGATGANVETVNDSLTTGQKVLGQSTNNIKFTNTYADVTVTGVATSIAPYITLVVVAAAAVAAYVVLKRRVAR